MNVILIWCWSWWLYAAAADLLQQDGVLVEERGVTRIVGGAWTVIVVLQAPSPPNITHLQQQISQYQESLGKQLTPMNKYVWQIRMDNINSHHETGGYRINLDDQSRSKRAVFDLIGDIQKYLFNSATMKDISQVTGMISQLETRIDNIVHNENDMMTAMNVTRTILQETQQDVQTLQTKTQDLVHFVNLMARGQKSHLDAIRMLQVCRIIDQTFIIMETAVNQYVSRAITFHARRMQLERGQLSREVLPQKHLVEILNMLSARGHVPLDLHWYYTYIPIFPIWERESGQMAFRVVIPAVSRVQFLSYELVYLPMPLTRNITRTINGQRNVALSTESGLSFTPSETSCVGNRPRVCYPIVQYFSKNCEANLLMGKLPSECNVTLAVRKKEKSIVYRSPSRLSNIVIVAYENIRVTQRCPTAGPKILQVKCVKQLYLNNLCSLESGDWKVKGIDMGEHNLSVGFKRPMNLPSINYSWPASVDYKIMEELHMHKRLMVPMIKLPAWGRATITEKNQHELSMVQDKEQELVWHVSLATLMVGSIVGFMIMIMGLRIYANKRFLRKLRCQIMAEASPKYIEPTINIDTTVGASLQVDTERQPLQSGSESMGNKVMGGEPVGGFNVGGLYPMLKVVK